MEQTKILIGLISREGDRLGHLVRGVQMLRSYGNEFKAIRYSKVINVPNQGGQDPALCCLVTGVTKAPPSSWRGMIRETQWALGDADGSRILQVHLIRYGDRISVRIPGPLRAIITHGARNPNKVYLPAHKFTRICGWGQQLTSADAPIAGEWPDATGP